MTWQEVIKVLETEKKCVLRNAVNNCNRECEKCDLALPDIQITTAYDKAIDFITGITYNGVYIDDEVNKMILIKDVGDNNENDNNRNERSEKRNLINIPMEIKIGGNIYKIERTDNLKLGSEKCKGEIDYQENIIRLTTGLKMQELEKTLIHEIVHGMCEFVSDRETNEDESKIEQITNLIYMFLRDNKELF